MPKRVVDVNSNLVFNVFVVQEWCGHANCPCEREDYPKTCYSGLEGP